jgi:hypothetical protein
VQQVLPDWQRCPVAQGGAQSWQVPLVLHHDVPGQVPQEPLQPSDPQWRLVQSGLQAGPQVFDVVSQTSVPTQQ